MATPGILYVAMQPKPQLPDEQFHEWYNNEHGPTRLRLPHIFTNGLRYRANDGQEPAYMAVYDVTTMPHLQTPTYTNLRGAASPYEFETISQVEVNRYFYDLIWEKQSPHFVPIELLSNDEAEDIELIVSQLSLKHEEGEAKFRAWYKEEHTGMLSRVPGWLRTRLFKTSSVEESGDPEHTASMSTDWAKEIFTEYVAHKVRRTYSLFYVFGSRQLSNGGSRICKHQSSEPGTLHSFVTTSDGLDIPYRLEGNPDPKASVVAFSNSLLTSMDMWNPFILILKEKRPDLCILRIALSEENHNMGIQMLATQTVARWFHTSSMKKEALLGLIRGPALLVAGEDDANGAVPRAMNSFKDKVSDKGVELKIVPETGHLPMCEKPQVFWEALERFLA
ncbi:3-oxoadipate enol-lactonase [Penicillium cf. viridicatum]|uniref:3-oxoadipate enol-lactonase n=1 Tax=Penicillium cf. viridicatum TaxID=2972119 RepID=A0A9W9MW10_9EURO|nr:3-oxoadipate enol-lactonase [Penicillium cf. viridicatum]